MASSPRRRSGLRFGGRLVLFVLVIMPAVLLVLVVNNWQATQESMSRESVITVSRSRIDAAKFVQQLHRSRAEDGANFDEVMLRLDILWSRRATIERVPDVRLGATSVQSEADRLLMVIDQIDALLSDESLPLADRLDAAAIPAEEMDSLFQRIETYALNESNQRIGLNMVRSEQLLWLTVLLSVGTLAAAAVIWRYRRRDTIALREKNAALEVARRQSEYTALHDDLSGLPNRRYFDRMLRTLAPADSRKSGVVLLHIDLDNFKQINDTFGHAAGDATLAAVGRRIDGFLGDGEFAARIGGDEFIIIFPDGYSQDELQRKSEALLTVLAKPVTYLDGTIRITASVGIATNSAEQYDPEELMLKADTALYRAKREGRSRTAFYSDALLAHTTSERVLIEDIRRGVAAREFIPFYQPQFDARTRALIGAEALVRWDHPQRGLLPPSEFIRLAEEIGLVAEIDDIVLEKSLADRAEALADGLCLPRLSVNVSAARLIEPGLIGRLDALHIEPDTLAFELVETVFLDDADSLLKANVERIRGMGIAIEIDDFGTGHASISGLIAIAPDRIKIDRVFVDGIENSVEKRTLLASVIAIGKSRKIEIVAEGVETEEQAAILTRLGCDFLQGYALGRPMPIAALRQLLSQIRGVRPTYAAS